MAGRDESAVTLRSVARQAGIAAPSIYRHFPDQPAIMLAVVQKAFTELNARLRVAMDAEFAQLAVTDDGRGYDAAEARERAAEGHFGLRGLESLVEDAGGTMTVQSQPGGGTRVDVEVPV